MKEPEIDIARSAQYLGYPVVFYPRIAHAFADEKVGMFLSYFLYWEGKQKDPDGWIFKTAKEIQRDTGLTRHAQEHARKKLVQLNVMEEEKRGVPGKMHFRFNWDMFNKILVNYVENNETVNIAPKRKVGGQNGEQEKAQPNLMYRLKETFLAYHKEAYPEPEMAYNWTDKDWKHIKYIKEALIKRLGKKGSEATDDNIVASFDLLLAKMPDYYREKQFFVSGIYSNLNNIIQEIYNQNGNRKSRSQGNKGNTGSKESFKEKARRASNG